MVISFGSHLNFNQMIAEIFLRILHEGCAVVSARCKKIVCIFWVIKPVMIMMTRNGIRTEENISS